MNNSIVGKLFFYDSDREKQTINYLKKIGFDIVQFNEKYKDYMDSIIFTIEFKEKPFIFNILEYNNFFGGENPNYIMISCISEDGLTFYIANSKFGDGFIFVPMKNINCIHTIKKRQIDSYICSNS